MLFRRPEINGCKSKLLFKPPAIAKLAAICSLLRGGGLGRGYSPNCSNLSNTFTAQIQALRLVALSLALSHGREDGVAVRVKGSARKQVVQAAFCFSDDLKSTVVNPSCFSNRLQSQNLLQSAPSSVGEGWGEGILRIAVTFPTPSPPKYKPCGLLPSLWLSPTGERTGWLFGLRVLQGNRLCRLLFAFQTTCNQRLLIQSAFQTACNRKICCNLLPPPWGRAGERAFSEFRQPSQTLQLPKYKPCGLLPSL